MVMTSCILHFNWQRFEVHAYIIIESNDRDFEPSNDDVASLISKLEYKISPYQVHVFH